MLTIPLDKWTGTDKILASQQRLEVRLHALEMLVTTLLQENTLMADVQKINQALETLQGKIDMTQENVEALKRLIKANPSAAELAEIERRLNEMTTDLGSTNFDTTQTTGGEEGGEETGDTSGGQPQG